MRLSKNHDKMKKSDLCPHCGGKIKPETKAFRTDIRDELPVLLKPPKDVADSAVAESSDDKTANDFAVVLKARKKRL